MKFPINVIDSSCASKYKTINTLFRNNILSKVDKKTFAIKDIKIETDNYYRRDGIFSDVLFTIKYNQDFMKGISEKEMEKYDKLVTGRIFCTYRNKKWYIEEFMLHFENTAWYWS